MTDAPERPCIVVSGNGRCGTSMMMQMLAAAGVPCLGRYPDFEDTDFAMSTFRPDRMAAARECALKILDPGVMKIPRLPHHVAIWMSRDPKQQTLSVAKLLYLYGVVTDRSTRRRLERDIRTSKPRHLGAFRDMPLGEVAFERILADPIGAATKLCAFLGRHGWPGLSPEKMAAVVVRRGPECLEGMLEFDLLEERGAA